MDSHSAVDHSQCSMVCGLPQYQVHDHRDRGKPLGDCPLAGSSLFIFSIYSRSTNIIQLDSRYFKGLAGEYDFALKFRVQKDGEEDYLVRSQSSHLLKRSANTEITLKPGRYYVLMKITAYRHPGVESTEETVSRLASTRREKLVQIGLSYDLAHAKGRVTETEKEKKACEIYGRRRKALEREKRRDETKRRLQKEWI